MPALLRTDDNCCPSFAFIFGGQGETKINGRPPSETNNVFPLIIYPSVKCLLQTGRATGDKTDQPNYIEAKASFGGGLVRA